MISPDELPIWPVTRAHEAARQMTDLLGLACEPLGTAPAVPSPKDAQAMLRGGRGLDDYLHSLGEHLGLSLELVVVRGHEIATFVDRSAPVLMRMTTPVPGLLPVLRRVDSSLEVLALDGTRCRVPVSLVEAALSDTLTARLRQPMTRLLDLAQVTDPKRRASALRTLLAQRSAQGSLMAGYLLRLSSSQPLRRHLAASGIPRWVGWFALAHLVQYVIGLLLFLMIGNGALSGRVDTGWLLGGALLLLAIVPIQLSESWLLGRIAIASSIVLRQRLLWGALRLPLETARRHGYGDFIGQTIESEGIEIGLRNGGLLTLTASLDLMGCLSVLGVSSPGSALLLGLWLAILALCGWLYFQARSAWTEQRFRLTGDLLEKMIGHRTRLVQEPAAARHRGEAQALTEYELRARRLDRTAVLLSAGSPYGWLFFGMASLAPLWLANETQIPVLALGLWGVLLGFRVISRLAAGLTQLAGSLIALQRCRHLLKSAARSELPAITATDPSFAQGEPLLSIHGINFRHTPDRPPVLRDLSLELRGGARVLLQGASGSGKSTLASVIAGLAPSERGQLLLAGLDMQTLGSARWRRLVATAPQFHENHLFSHSLAFNLLIGRGWPPVAQDFDDAEEICLELGLGPLLDRMPSRLQQFVGETGWQLSHGERSRVFIARTLLQGAPLILLDESFAALDPASLVQALRCVLRRAHTLVVISHP